MKKLIVFLLFTMFFVLDVKAETIYREDVGTSTYIIGKYMFTRDSDENSNYDGTLTTKRIMLAAKTISGNSESDMIIYYKTPGGYWINALTGSEIEVPFSFEIESVNFLPKIDVSINNVDLSEYSIYATDIDESTYIIGNHMFTRNINRKDNYNGKLNTTKIMLAAKTIVGNNEADMNIYYKTPSGKWIDALTGTEVSVQNSFEISTINLRNQLENPYTADLDAGTTVNTKLKKLAGNSLATYSLKDGNILSIKEVEQLPADLEISDDNIISADNSDLLVYAWYSNGTINYFLKKYYPKEANIYLNSNSGYLFYNLNNLKNIDLNHIDTSQVTNMNNMFEECNSLENINLTNFNTSNVTTMYGMFNGCTSLKNISFLSFNTLKLTDTSYMFNNCENITNLDLSSFDLSSLKNYSNMFYGMSLLAELKTPKASSDYEIVLPKKMYDILDNGYTSLTNATPTETILKLPNMLNKATEFNIKIKTLAGNSEASSSTKDENIKAIKRVLELPNIELEKDNILSLPNSTEPLYVWYEEETINYYTAASKIYLPTEATYMFANLTNLKSIDLSIFDSSQVVYMSYMFYNCNNLLSIDLSNFDLSKVKSATSVFDGTTSLISLNTPKVNANVKILLAKHLYDSSGKEYTKITNDLNSSILLESKTSIISGQAFNERIKRLAGNSVATYSNNDRNITEIRHSQSLPDIELDENNIISSEDSSRLIYAWYDEGVIYYYTEASRIYLSNNSSYMFSNLKVLTNVDLDIINTGNVTNMGYMFDGCEKLISLNLSNFDMSKVIITDYMLNGLSSLGELNTPKVITNQTITLPHPMYDIQNNKYEYLTLTTHFQIILKKEWN